MNYVALVLANGVFLPVVETNTDRVRIFEDQDLAKRVVNVFSDQFQTNVVTYQKYLDALNGAINMQQLFEEENNV